LSNDQLHEVYHSWNESQLNSYLIEITSDIFAMVDDKTGKKLIDVILGIAQQNGTGMWTSQSSMELQMPTPTIDMAVSLRDLSVLVKEREQARVLYQRPIQRLDVDKKEFLTHLKGALFTGMIVAYAQGLALLRVASEHYSYHLDLASVARIWRGGCIIRSQFLEDICAAFRANSKLPNLLLDDKIAQKVAVHRNDLRQVLCQSITAGVSTPALMATQSYLDAYCSAWQPDNLIQAQRDYFGSHTYERIDTKGIFHTEWKKD
jgi:6-phosphogluconate dehydrogenase